MDTMPRQNPLIRRKAKILRQIGYVMLATIVLMCACEYVKQMSFISPYLPQSNIFTILFSGFAAALAAYFVLSRYDKTNHQLRSRISEYN